MSGKIREESQGHVAYPAFGSVSRRHSGVSPMRPNMTGERPRLRPSETEGSGYSTRPMGGGFVPVDTPRRSRVSSGATLSVREGPGRPVRRRVWRPSPPGHAANQYVTHRMARETRIESQALTGLLETIQVIIEPEEASLPHVDHVVGDIGARETPVEQRQPCLADGHEPAVHVGHPFNRRLIRLTLSIARCQVSSSRCTS